MALDGRRKEGHEGGSCDREDEAEKGETGFFIMQKLSQQLVRSSSTPLHRHRHVVRMRGCSALRGLVETGLEKASAPE